MAERSESIFSMAYDRRLRWNGHSDEFVKYAPYAIKRALRETAGFAEFNKFVNYHIAVDANLPGWLSLSFGHRPMGRPAVNGLMASERGPSLVYSRGPSGEMSVVLYPVRSEVASPVEGWLILRIGYFDYWDLYTGVRRDIRDLIAYAYVTSIDLSPTLSQRIRVGWLRFASRQYREGKSEYSPLRSGVLSFLKLALSGSVSGIFRVAAPFVIGVLVGRYGNEWLKTIFEHMSQK